MLRRDSVLSYYHILPSYKTTCQQLLSLQVEHEAVKRTVEELESKILVVSVDVCSYDSTNMIF